MNVLHLRAPATTANLGPGFDCLAAALDLWNELELSLDGELMVTVEGEGADEAPCDESHLALRAFSLVAPLHGGRFHFTNRIPFARGLGSSAATVALGLVAGALASGRSPQPEELLELGLPLEGHADNLAAALAGGVCLTWSAGGRQRLSRLSSALPVAAVAVVPELRTRTEESRRALPSELPFADAVFSVSRAALLGAALVRGDSELLHDAFEDRLHEPYRTAGAPLLGAIRASLPEGALAATLSGSGPAVVVWAREEAAALCVAALEERFPDERVLCLRIASLGARSYEP